MNPNVGALMFTACATASLGLVAFLRASQRPTNRLFGIHASVVTLWVWVTCQIELSGDPQWTTTLLRIVHVASAFVLATFVDFIWVFPDRLRNTPIRRRVVLYAVTCAFCPAVLHHDFVRGLQISHAGLSVQFGWPLAVFGLWLVALVAHANYVLWYKWRTFRGVARIQTSYVLAGTMISEVIILTTNVILPMVTGRTDYSRWGAVGYQITIVAVTIAVAKYHLWELSGLWRRFLGVALAFAGVVAIGGAATWGLWPWLELWNHSVQRTALFALVLGGLIGLVLPPASKFLSDLVSGSAQAERERIGKLLGALGAAIVHAPAGRAALLPILEETQRYYAASSVEAYLRGSDGKYRNAGTVPAAPDEVSYAQWERSLPATIVDALGARSMSEPLESGRLLRFGSVEESTQILAAMDAINASVVAPLRWSGETIGLLLLGPKVERGMYSPIDIDILKSITAHAAIAIKNAELRDQIVQEKQRTERVLAQMENGVVVADSDRVILLVNQAAITLLNMSESQLLGQSTDVLPEAVRQPLHRALTEGELVSGARVDLDYGIGLRVACSAFPVPGEGDVREGACLVLRDLRTEDALQRSEREKERLQFIRAVSAGMAHEIRNPLVAIRTFAELAPSRLDDPEFRNSFVQVAQSEIRRLEDLVSQFMTLAKPARAVSEPIDVRRLLAGAMMAVSARAQAQNIELCLEADEMTPVIYGDEPRLYQALMNLLLNALDAAPPGGQVALRAGPETPSAYGNGPATVLTVWNSGSYIPPEQREQVFEPFFTSKATGTGLGLAICNTIVDEHGGTMTVESDMGTGTAFTITVPVAVPRQQAVITA